MSEEEAVPSYGELLALGKRIQEKAAEALAEELDTQNIAKTGDQGFIEDFFGIDDYWAEDFMGEFAHIPHRFIASAGANPDQLDGVMEYLANVSRLLADERIQDIKEDIKDATFDWEGDGALNFRMFIRPLYECAGNQMLLVDGAIVLIGSYQEVLRQHRRDLKALGEEVEAALDQIIGGGTPSGTAILYAFNMLIMVTLTAVNIQGTALKIGVAIANKIWGDLSSQIQSNLDEGGDAAPTPREYGIGRTLGSSRASTRGVIDDMFGAIIDLEDERRQNEELIASKLTEVFGTIDAEGRNKFEAPRPNIADDMSKLTSSGRYGFGAPG